jgi:hypothetical protein
MKHFLLLTFVVITKTLFGQSPEASQKKRTPHNKAIKYIPVFVKDAQTKAPLTGVQLVTFGIMKKFYTDSQGEAIIEILDDGAKVQIKASGYQEEIIELPKRSKSIVIELFESGESMTEIKDDNDNVSRTFPRGKDVFYHTDSHFLYDPLWRIDGQIYPSSEYFRLDTLIVLVSVDSQNATKTFGEKAKNGLVYGFSSQNLSDWPKLKELLSGKPIDPKYLPEGISATYPKNIKYPDANFGSHHDPKPIVLSMQKHAVKWNKPKTFYAKGTEEISEEEFSKILPDSIDGFDVSRSNDTKRDSVLAGTYTPKIDAFYTERAAKSIQEKAKEIIEEWRYSISSDTSKMPLVLIDKQETSIADFEAIVWDNKKSIKGFRILANSEAFFRYGQKAKYGALVIDTKKPNESIKSRPNTP